MANLAFLIKTLTGINPNICEDELIFNTNPLINGHHTRIINNIVTKNMIIDNAISKLWKFDTDKWIFLYNFSMKNTCAA